MRGLAPRRVHRLHSRAPRALRGLLGASERLPLETRAVLRARARLRLVPALRFRQPALRLRGFGARGELERVARAREVLRLRKPRLEVANGLAQTRVLIRGHPPRLRGGVRGGARPLQARARDFALERLGGFPVFGARRRRGGGGGALHRAGAPAPSRLGVRACGVELAAGHGELVQRLREVDLRGAQRRAAQIVFVERRAFVGRRVRTENVRPVFGSRRRDV